MKHWAFVVLATVVGSIVATCANADTYFSQATTYISAAGQTPEGTGQTSANSAYWTSSVTALYIVAPGVYSITSNNGSYPLVSRGEATAEANRATGELRVIAGESASYNGQFPFPASATATFGDTLIFVNPNPNSEQIIQFTVHVDGTLGAIGSPGANWGLYLGLDQHQGSFNSNAANVVSGYAGAYSWGGFSGDFSNDFTGQITITGASAIVPIYMSLSAYGSYDMADLSHTATFSFTNLPEGVTFSASGGLLTAAVPELSTWAMMILGFCGLGFLAHRRHSAASPHLA